MNEGIELRPLTADNLYGLEPLFAADRSTRHCWCTAFCSTGSQFAAGWFGGGNRRRFAALAAASAHPMGVLALLDGEPVGWCACGPRSRYVPAIDGRSWPLKCRPRDEDDRVWLIACLYAEARRRRLGITHALIVAAIELARNQGAVAIEGWPAAGPAPASSDLFLGRQDLFEGNGFRCVDHPSVKRCVMRLDLP